MSLQTLMNNVVNVETPTFTQSKGARVKTYSTKYSGINVRIQPLDAKAIALFQRDGMNITHRIYIAQYGSIATLVITQAERIKFGSRFFQVTGVRNPDEMNRFLVLDCTEIKS